MAELDQALLRGLHTSLCIRWGTSAPYRITGLGRAEKIGFAAIPVLTVTVFCRDNDLGSLIPIVRQRLYAELAERGWESETIAFTPSVARGRERIFEDENESSETLGRRKRGVEHDVHFEIVDRELKAQTFPVGRGTYSRIPERA